MAGAHQRLAAGLDALARGHLLRTRRVLQSPQGPRVVVDGRELANFSSNDYLGLATHPALADAAHASIARWGVGSGASALVSGHAEAHEAAERRFASFAGVERALLFGSGYLANLGILAALADRHAEIFSDRLNHACLIDGALLSRATVTRYAHADVDALARRLESSTAATKVIATDAVFSMDGDVAPLRGMLALAERHDAWLVVDDAHGIGVLGRAGRGTLDELALASPRIVHMATLGKALGGYGAFVGGQAQVVEWLLQRARPYVFSTALPAFAADVARAAIDLLEAEPARVARLGEHIARFRAACAARGVRLEESRTAIQPLLLGDAERALRASRLLQERGFLVPAIRPPTVPEGTSRLRLTVMANHRADDLQRAARVIGRAARELGIADGGDQVQLRRAA